MSPLRIIALAACLVALVACKDKIAVPKSIEPVQAASAAVAMLEEDAANADATADPGEQFRIVAIVLGNSVDAEQLVIADRELFARKDTFHASVISTGASQGVRLTARWLAPNGEVVAESHEPLVPTTAVATTFSLVNPDGWPAGEYEVQIAINGKPAQSRRFQVL